MERISIEDVRTTTYKGRDSWWTVFLVDPYTSHLVRFAAPYRWITPNRLTVVATILGLGAAACFAVADWHWLLAGAVLFHLSFVIDCMDGKIARLNGTGSVFGMWLDYIFDRVRVLACAVALMGGQFRETGRTIYLVLAFVVVVLDMFHYLDLLEISKVKAEMRRRLQEAQAAYEQITGGTTDAAADALIIGTDAADAPPIVPTQTSAHDLSQDFRARFGGYLKVRNFLVDNRVRPNVVSGIEFQMAVFIVAPVVHGIIAVTLLMAGLLLTFELAVIYKLWLASKAFARKFEKLTRQTEQVRRAAPAPARDAEPQLNPTAA